MFLARPYIGCEYSNCVNWNILAVFSLIICSPVFSTNFWYFYHRINFAFGYRSVYFLIPRQKVFTPRYAAMINFLNADARVAFTASYILRREMRDQHFRRL